MSGDEISVQRDQLGRDAKRFGEGAQKVLNILRNLDSQLSSEGKCWGPDATGKGFETKYEKPREDAYNAFTALSNKLNDAQSAVEAMTKNYNSAESSTGV